MLANLSFPIRSCIRLLLSRWSEDSKGTTRKAGFGRPGIRRV